MAMNMDAMLKIRASVEGQNQIVALNRGLQSVGTTAAGVTGAMRGLTGAAGGLSGALGTLAPLLSAAGLVGMVKNTIEAGDKMNDLAQSTGVSVEALARFKKAASVSGTSLEGVSKGLIKLSKTMLDAATGGKASVATFQALGISVKSADGSLKSADQVMLEVADRFKAMPDGAAKTALALRLFGKSGAELVPMLNMGGAAIDKLKVKMTAAFAERADAYNDKLAALSGKVGALGADLTIALLPALEQITNALTTAVTAFNELPAPIKSAAVGAATLAVAWGPLSGALGGATKLLAGVANGLEFMRYQAALAGGVMPLLTGGIEAMSAAILAIPGWGWALAGVAALGLLGKALYDNNSAFRSWVNNVGTIVAADFQNAMKNMVQLGAAAARKVNEAWQWLVNATTDAANRIGQAFGAPYGFIANTAQTVFSRVAGAIARMWNAIPAPVRKALGEGAKNALGPVVGYATDVAIRAFQMPPQQVGRRAGQAGGAAGIAGFSPDLSALETGGGGKKKKKEKDDSDKIRQQIVDSANALAQSRAELAILKELDPIKKIQLEYDEKRRGVIAAAANELSKAMSVEEQANIQRKRGVDLRRLDIEQTNALKDKYKELGEAAYEAALNAAQFATIADRMRPTMAGIMDGIEKYKESVGTMQEQVAGLAEQTLGALASGISNIIATAVTDFKAGAQAIKQELANMLKSIGQSLVKFASDMIANQAIKLVTQLIGSMLGSGLNLSGANALSTTKLTPGGVFATGGVMTGAGPLPLKRYAGGGVAKSPQMAMFGERGPEAYVPLPDGRSIPVTVKQRSDALNRYRPISANGTGTQNGAIATTEGVASASATAIDVRYTVSRINSVDYVTADQFQQGLQKAAAQGAARGEQSALRRLQQSRATRNRLGLG